MPRYPSDTYEYMWPQTLNKRTLKREHAKGYRQFPQPRLIDGMWRLSPFGMNTDLPWEKHRKQYCYFLSLIFNTSEALISTKTQLVPQHA